MTRVFLSSLGVVLCLLLAHPQAVAQESAAPGDKLLAASQEVSQFMADPKLAEAFIKIARADHKGRISTKKGTAEWAKAKKDPAAYLAGLGITVPTDIRVEFSFTSVTPAQGMYCIDSCKNLHGATCANCSHPEKTGCFHVRQCYPLSSL